MMFRLIIALAAIFSATDCHAIDLEEVISKAIKNSSKLKSQFCHYKSAEKQLKSIGLIGFLPDISLQYRFNEKFGFEDKTGGRLGLGRSLTLNQRIIDGGGTFATFSRSRHLLNGEWMQFQQLKQEIALSAVRVYVDVLSRTEILKLREHKERVSLEHLSAMKKRFSLGEVTKAEVSLAKAKLSFSVLERVDAEGQLKLANIAYFHLIGEDPDELSEANDELPSFPKLNECLKLAKTNNLSLKAAIYQKRAAEMEVIAEASRWVPSLNLSTSKVFREDGFSFDEFLDNVNIVFTLDIPIFKRGINVFGIGKAKMDVKKSTFNYHETVKNIEKEVVNAWNNVLTVEAVIKASREAEKAAALALEGVEQEVGLNLKSTTELLDTEDALFKARSDLVKAKSDYVISVYNLLFMINSINL